MKSRLMMRLLVQTLLPVPVAPATNRCGALARSTTTGLPETSLPRAMGMSALPLRHASDSITERMKTAWLLVLETSTPTTGRPGIGASTRTLSAERFIAMLFSICSTFLTLTPGARVISKRVTRGPEV